MHWIKRAWFGKEKLCKVFWLYLSVSNILMAVGFLIILPNEFAGLLVLFFAFFNVWGAVVLWKCSFNTKRLFWEYAARIAFCLGLTSEVVTFYFFFLPIGDNICNNGYPKESVDCRLIVSRSLPRWPASGCCP